MNHNSKLVPGRDLEDVVVPGMSKTVEKLFGKKPKVPDTSVLTPEEKEEMREELDALFKTEQKNQDPVSQKTQEDSKDMYSYKDAVVSSMLDILYSLISH